MKKYILHFAGIFILMFPFAGYAQNTMSSAEQKEKIFSFWSSRMEMARVEVGADKQQFDVFTRFYAHQIDSMQIDYINKANKNIITVNNARQIMDEKKNTIITLYNKFIQVENEFPSSIDEYRNAPRPRLGSDTCYAACHNTDFEDGTLSGWYGYYGVNSSPDDNIGPFSITGITGGYCGPVVKAANDPFTGSYQIRITSGATTDPFLSSNSTYSMPEVSPWGGSHSVMLGDSILAGQGTAILSQSFAVTPTTSSLTYQYALFLENPNGHLYYAQPFFSVAVLDQNGDTIPVCGQYSVDASNAQSSHFIGIFNGSDTVYWKNWTLVNVPLKKYVGQCVTLIFQIQDCSLGGHYGYAYVDASCSPLAVITSSPAICGQDSISLTAPPGSSNYLWRGPKNGILGDTTQQVVWVDSAGVYSVITIPVTGAACADTLVININKAPGPPPRPNFTTNSPCAGQSTYFNNISTPLSGTKFYWDFYNLGIFNDTNVVSPTWAYSSPGTYNVKLYALHGGCGADTVISVNVLPSVVSSFNVSAACLGSPVTMNNTSTGATKYLWNYGDPGSAPQDTSSNENGSHLYTTTGTYTATLIAKNGATCPDTVSLPIVVYTYPKPIITTHDSVCTGTKDTLSVTGGTTYAWSVGGGATTDSVSVTVSTTRTITVNAFNGGCEHDTAVTIYTVTNTPLIASSKDSVCSGDSLTLMGSGGSKYKWKPGGQTTAKIHVNPTVATTYTLYVTRGECEDSTKKTIGMVKPITFTILPADTTICIRNPLKLSVSLSGGPALSYKWSPGGATTAQINVNPSANITYTATVYGKCDTVNNFANVVVVALPKPVISGQDWECRGFRDNLTVTNENGSATYVWSDGKTGDTYATGDIYADSTVSVEAFNSSGCDTTISYAITLRIPPDITKITLPSPACSGEPVELSVTAIGTNGPFTYTWDPGGNGDTITVNPTSATIYSVTVSNGCTTIRSTTVTPEYPVMNVCCNATIVIGNDTTVVASGNSKKYRWQDSTMVTCLNPPLCDSVKVGPNATTTFTVIGTDALGCQLEQPVTITVDVPCFNFTVPNVITPNGDYKNDILEIKTKDLDGWSMLIYDRWGNEVFKSTSAEGFWTGLTEGGSEAPDGVYYYVINATCQGNSYKKTGFIQLIR